MASRLKIIGLAGVVVLLAARAIPAQQNGRSPALCSPFDMPETGIQGEIPSADQSSGRAAAGYNCGLALLGEAASSSTAVQGAGHCAYVRIGGGMTSGGAPLPNVQIKVIDLSDPTAPTEVRTLQTASGSETMRALVTGERALLVSGRSVFDIRDCENPVLKGEIEWPGIAPWPAGAYHDIRVSHDGKKVYAGLYAIEVDISDLEDPSTWRIKNHTCTLLAQESGSEPEQCEAAYEFNPDANYGHGHDDNANGTRLYVGTQQDIPLLRIIDLTANPVRIVGSIPESPGHSIDWFRIADGREFLLHANELDTGDTCTPHPRTSALGWAYEAFLTDITNDTAPTRASMVELAINKPEFCTTRQASASKPYVVYHKVDNPYNASFAMVSFGSAGLRVFDIRNPYAPKEVAYFNRGALAHAGVSHYDAARGLVLVPGNGLRVLEIEPQVYDALGLPHPTDPAYPRFVPEPNFALSLASGIALLLLQSFLFDPARRRARSCAAERAASSLRSSSADTPGS